MPARRSTGCPALVLPRRVAIPVATRSRCRRARLPLQGRASLWQNRGRPCQTGSAPNASRMPPCALCRPSRRQAPASRASASTGRNGGRPIAPGGDGLCLTEGAGHASTAMAAGVANVEGNQDVLDRDHKPIVGSPINARTTAPGISAPICGLPASASSPGTFATMRCRAAIGAGRV